MNKTFLLVLALLALFTTGYSTRTSKTEASVGVAEPQEERVLWSQSEDESREENLQNDPPAEQEPKEEDPWWQDIGCAMEGEEEGSEAGEVVYESAVTVEQGTQDQESYEDYFGEDIEYVLEGDEEESESGEIIYESAVVTETLVVTETGEEEGSEAGEIVYESAVVTETLVVTEETVVATETVVVTETGEQGTQDQEPSDDSWLQDGCALEAEEESREQEPKEDSWLQDIGCALEGEEESQEQNSGNDEQECPGEQESPAEQEEEDKAIDTGASGSHTDSKSTVNSKTTKETPKRSSQEDSRARGNEALSGRVISIPVALLSAFSAVYILA